jgi:hypothetical protein
MPNNKDQGAPISDEKSLDKEREDILRELSKAVKKAIEKETGKTIIRLKAHRHPNRLHTLIAEVIFSDGVEDAFMIED